MKTLTRCNVCNKGGSKKYMWGVGGAWYCQECWENNEDVRKKAIYFPFRVPDKKRQENT